MLELANHPVCRRTRSPNIRRSQGHTVSAQRGRAACPESSEKKSAANNLRTTLHPGGQLQQVQQKSTARAL